MTPAHTCDLTDPWMEATDPTNERGEVATGHFLTNVRGAGPGVALDRIDVSGGSILQRDLCILVLGRAEVERLERLVAAEFLASATDPLYY